MEGDLDPSRCGPRAPRRRRCRRPRRRGGGGRAAPVEPMYIPGRSRTGSRPSRTVMSFAVYAVSVIKKALQMSILRAESSVSETAVGPGLRGARARLAAAARATYSRSSSSSIAAAISAASARCSAPTSGGVGARRSAASALGLRDRPGSEAERRRRRVAELGSRAARGSSAASRPSSNAHVAEAVLHVQRPVAGEARRPGVARHRLADRVRPGAHDRRPCRRRHGAAEAAELAAHLAVEAVHQRHAHAAGRRPRAAAPARAAAPRRRSRSRSPARRGRSARRASAGGPRRAPRGRRRAARAAASPRCSASDLRLGEQQREHGQPLLALRAEGAAARARRSGS